MPKPKADILDGAKQLLRETVEILTEADALRETIVVGGWGPFIRHRQVHPGTRDIDILFASTYSPRQISQIMDRYLNREYFISAKHDFQLCRAIELGNHTYIYNVDLLHPTEGKINKVDFVEIMKLDVSDGSE